MSSDVDIKEKGPVSYVCQYYCIRICYIPFELTGLYCVNKPVSIRI